MDVSSSLIQGSPKTLIDSDGEKPSSSNIFDKLMVYEPTEYEKCSRVLEHAKKMKQERDEQEFANNELLKLDRLLSIRRQLDVNKGVDKFSLSSSKQELKDIPGGKPKMSYSACLELNQEDASSSSETDDEDDSS